MKKLSSDFLFYKSTIGLILGPIAIFLFIRFFWENNFPNTAVIISYVLLGFFVIIQWYRWSKNRRVLFNNDHFLIENYFIKKSIQIPINSVEKIEEVFGLNGRNAMKLYKITFIDKGKRHVISFFKAPEVANLKDLENAIKIKKGSA